MNIERFIARRIIKGSGNGNNFSRPVVKISVLGITLGLTVMILTVSIIKGFQKEIQNKLNISNLKIELLNQNIQIDNL